MRYFCPLFSGSVRFSGAVPVFPSYSRKNGKKVEWRNDCRLSGMTDTPEPVIRHHLMPFGCRLVIPPSFQTQIWIAFFCHSSSIDEADMPPNDDDFHSEAIPPATHERGPFRRSSSFHKTKLHPNDGHFHLVVNPSPIQGKGLYVHLVHKSMILQSGPFLVLEPQKYTCLPVLGMKNHNFCDV